MPTLTIEAAIIDNGRILLVRDARWPAWRLPGIELADGETPAEALIQALKAELGLDVRLGRLLGLYTRPRWRCGGDTTCLFLALIIGSRRQLDACVDQAQFFSPRTLPENLLPWCEERIADAYAGQQRALVRTQDVPWPFATDDPARVVSSLVEEGFSEREQALRECLRRLGVKALEEEIARYAEQEEV